MSLRVAEVSASISEKCALCIQLEGLHYPGVAMALIDSRISRKKIEIAFAFDIPDEDSLATFQHYRKRVVIMGAVPLFQGDIIGR